LSYSEVKPVKAVQILLSAAVFCVFGLMFYKMSIKHGKRIRSYRQKTKPVWHFFDWKSYLIMAFMMGGGIWLRASGLVPPVFIAVFYTGLGLRPDRGGDLHGCYRVSLNARLDTLPAAAGFVPAPAMSILPGMLRRSSRVLLKYIKHETLTERNERLYGTLTL